MRNVVENGASLGTVGAIDWPGEIAGLLGGSLFGPFGAVAGALGVFVHDASGLLQDLQTIAGQNGIFTLDPIRTKLTSGDLDLGKVATWAASGRHVFAVAVALESGELRIVDHVGRVFDRNLAPVPNPFSAGPSTCAALRDRVLGLQQSIRDLVEKLRESAGQASWQQLANLRVELASAQAAYAECIAQQRETGSGPQTTVNVIDGIIASCSAPPGAPPVPLGGETCADGGVRAVLPTEIAVAAGASTIYAVSCSPIAIGVAPPQGGWKIPDIASRSVDLLLEEVVYDQALPVAGPGIPVKLVAPDIDIHSGEVVDPGLIQINRDYGYMRASDVLDGIALTDPGWSLATEISRLRQHIWHDEILEQGKPDPTTPWASPGPPQPNLANQISNEKTQLASMIASRRAAGRTLPAGIDAYTSGREKHPW